MGDWGLGSGNLETATTGRRLTAQPFTAHQRRTSVATAAGTQRATKAEETGSEKKGAPVVGWRALAALARK